MLQRTADCIDTLLESRSNVGRILVKQILKLPSCLLLAVLVVNGCNSKGNDKDLFSYKDLYVGNVSVVGNILNRLYVQAYKLYLKLMNKI